MLPEDLAQTEYELNQVRLRALRDARAAQEAEQRKNDLIVYLAHDLKTPLTSVIGYLTLLCPRSPRSCGPNTPASPCTRLSVWRT